MKINQVRRRGIAGAYSVRIILSSLSPISLTSSSTQTPNGMSSHLNVYVNIFCKALLMMEN